LTINRKDGEEKETHWKWKRTELTKVNSPDRGYTARCSHTNAPRLCLYNSAYDTFKMKLISKFGQPAVRTVVYIRSTVHSAYHTHAQEPRAVTGWVQFFSGRHVCVWAFGLVSKCLCSVFMGWYLLWSLIITYIVIFVWSAVGRWRWTLALNLTSETGSLGVVCS
jgi:hypothetical protein